MIPKAKMVEDDKSYNAINQLREDFQENLEKYKFEPVDLIEIEELSDDSSSSSDSSFKTSSLS